MSTVNSSGVPPTPQDRKLRICLVALNAYPVINPSATGTFGGIETRSWMFARALARLPDTEVHFVVRHSQQLQQKTVDGVHLELWLDRLYTLRESVRSRVSLTSRFPWIQIRQPSWSLFWQLPLLALSKLLRGGSRDPLTPHPLFQKIPADLFLTFGVQSNSATVIASAHLLGKPAALFLGSDGDLDERYARQEQFVSVYRDRADVCYWLIKQADHIFSQTPLQAKLLYERFQRDSTVIPNPIDTESWEQLSQQTIQDPVIKALPRYALWIGRAEGVHKRPQLCIELAQLCPDVHFLMIMNPRDDVLDQQIRHSAPPNVTIVRTVPFEQIPAVFRRAAVLVNTSSLEGFPNTFLQAALSRVPVASLVVEPEFLRDTRSGQCAGGDLNSLAKFVKSCWKGVPGTDPELARQLISNRHSLIPTAQQLAQTLRSLVDRQSASPHSRT